MLFLFYVIFGYYMLFHFRLFVIIINYFGYFKLFHLRLFSTVLVDISGYFKLNYHRLLMIINGYYISGCWWLFY
jgi:hypothetical protein